MNQQVSQSAGQPGSQSARRPGSQAARQHVMPFASQGQYRGDYMTGDPMDPDFEFFVAGTFNGWSEMKKMSWVLRGSRESLRGETRAKGRVRCGARLHGLPDTAAD